jgi:ATP-dependent Clp protease ATP-binding subunit ClpC
MWVQFTKRARELFDLAQEEAAAHGQREVGTEHLLPAITKSEHFVAYQVLEKAGISPHKLRTQVENRAAVAEPVVKEGQHLTPGAHRVTDLAYDEARAMDNKYIGTEHILLGLLTEDRGIAAQVMAEAGINREQILMILEQLSRG